eukprot:2119490-Rhodomonas_salina.1
MACACGKKEHEGEGESASLTWKHPHTYDTIVDPVFGFACPLFPHHTPSPTKNNTPVSYTHLRAHETEADL